MYDRLPVCSGKPDQLPDLLTGHWKAHDEGKLEGSCLASFGLDT